MLLYLVVFIFTGAFLTLLGYLIHRAFHQKWSGTFYRRHYDHHFLQYPTTSLISDTYRQPNKGNSSVWLFAICFSPLILGTLLITVFGIIPLGIGIMIFIEMGLIAFLNDNMHDAFHIRKTFWARFGFFKRLRRLHFLHHQNTQSNFGVFSLTWDKIFGTYNNK
jgi:sterol desaturase/sphingolipid hydroxylase (fatty acid hydroxylase superfamily)